MVGDDPHDIGGHRLRLVMAAWRLGAIVTPVNPTFTTDEAGHQIADAAARLVVHDRVRADLSGFDTLDVDDLAPPRPDDAPVTLSAVPADPGDDVALLIYTSGSTGRPKGVMHRHQQTRRDRRRHNGCRHRRNRREGRPRRTGTGMRRQCRQRYSRAAGKIARPRSRIGPARPPRH